MRYYPAQRIAMIAIAGLLLLVAVGGATVLAQEPEAELSTETVYITSPAEGETVSGIITITGAVDFPDFFKYEVFLRSGEQLVWVATVYAPVINGNLARLDTKTVADGSYQLITRQVRSDSNYTEFVGPTVTIKNDLGAPLPFPEVYSSPLYPPKAGALLRVHSCAGFNTEFDYVSPQGFCSSGNLWLKPKLQDQPLCTTMDIFLIPDCEYRGTIVASDGKSRGSRYEFVAEKGKIYELHYPGADRIFLGEVKGDERAETDVGGLDYDDPARQQVTQAAPASSGGQAAPVLQSEASAAPASTPASEAAAPAPTPGSEPSADEQTLLPVSGQATESAMPFAFAAVGLIVLMVIGGVVAIRKGMNSA